MAQLQDYAQFLPFWRTPEFQRVEPSTIPWENSTKERQELLRAAWTAGHLRYKLDFDQQGVYDEFRGWYKRPLTGKKSRGTKFFCFDMSRRYGKSSTGLALAFEERLRNTFDKRIVYWCATQEHAERIVNEILPWLLSDCPPELRPIWERKRNHLVWRHDHKDLHRCRRIELAGFTNPDAPRGGSLFFGIVDEAGMVGNLNYIQKAVIRPMLTGIENSCVLYISTPAISPTHPWSAQIIPDCQRHGTWVRRTIFDNPRLSNEEILQEIEAQGGIKDPTVQREWLARHIPDTNLTILPEAQEAFDDGWLELPEDYLAPPWRHCYTSMDPGWTDATGLLFGYVDFVNQWLVIEDEWLEPQAPSSMVAEAVKRKEKELWHGTSYFHNGDKKRNPYRRWSDIDKRLVSDLHYDHELSFAFTEKDRLQNQINRVRNMLLNREIKIHPRCVNLKRQMISGVFKNDTRREFKREDKFQHYDLLACLIYMARGAWPLFRKNPNAPRVYNPQKFQVLPEAHATPQESRYQNTRRSQRSNQRVRSLRSGRSNPRRGGRRVGGF